MGELEQHGEVNPWIPGGKHCRQREQQMQRPDMRKESETGDVRLVLDLVITSPGM